MPVQRGGWTGVLWRIKTDPQATVEYQMKLVPSDKSVAQHWSAVLGSWQADAQALAQRNNNGEKEVDKKCIAKHVAHW